MRLSRGERETARQTASHRKPGDGSEFRNGHMLAVGVAGWQAAFAPSRAPRPDVRDAAAAYSMSAPAQLNAPQVARPVPM